ncbi:MAG: hypothetical protein SGJ05_10515 [bacterium]|nr:hypothetical protein [bacterium]
MKIFALLLTICLGNTDLQSCVCNKISFTEQIEKIDFAFSGKIISKSRVASATTNGKLTFEVGERYIFYAYSGREVYTAKETESVLSTHLCTRTQLASDKDEITMLDNYAFKRARAFQLTD